MPKRKKPEPKPGDNMIGRIRIPCTKAADNGAADHNFLPGTDPTRPVCAWCGRAYPEVYP